MNVRVRAALPAHADQFSSAGFAIYREQLERGYGPKPTLLAWLLGNIEETVATSDTVGWWVKPQSSYLVRISAHWPRVDGRFSFFDKHCPRWWEQ